MKSNRYGGGLPKVGARPLREGERAEVRRAMLGAWGWLGASGTAVALAVALAFMLPVDAPVFAAGLVLVGLATVSALVLGSVGVRAGVLVATLAQGMIWLLAHEMPEARPPHPALVAFVRVFTVILASGFVLSRLRGAFGLLRRRSELGEDLHGGEVERCAGRVGTPTDAPTFRILRRRGDLSGDGPRHELEILPRSGFILRVDGHRPSRPLLAPITSIAPAAPHALRVALPSDLRAIASPAVALQRRSSTPAERDEIGRHASALRRPPWPLGLALPASVAAGLWQWQHALSEHPWWGALAIGAQLAAGAAVFHYVQRVRTASRLRADAELRWLVTAVDRDAPEGATPDLEMLPVSGLAWTERAQPAAWRLDG